MRDLSLFQIKSYYDRYKDVDITFNKKVMEFMHVLPKEIYVKCKDNIYPCIINSSSMVGARIIIKADKTFFEYVKKNNDIVHLRFAFDNRDNSRQICFYILSRVKKYTLFDKNKPGLFFIQLKYTQRPPNDLVIILGNLIEAGSNIKKRKNERIIITPGTLRLLKIEKAQAVLLLDNTHQKCILRDISLSGAKVIASGNVEKYPEKEIVLIIRTAGKNTLSQIPGRIKRCEEIKGQKEFVTLAIEYIDGKIPAEYSKRIIDYMSKHSIKVVKTKSI